MRHDERQCILVRGADMDEMDVSAGHPVRMNAIA